MFVFCVTFVAPDTTGCTDFTYLLPGTISVYLLRVQVRVLLSSMYLALVKKVNYVLLLPGAKEGVHYTGFAGVCEASFLSRSVAT